VKLVPNKKCILSAICLSILLLLAPASFAQDQLPQDYEGFRRLGEPLLPLPFRGGSITSREKALIPMGGFSMVQNMRGEHPGFKKRPGQRTLHSTTDGTNEVISLHQFNKNAIDENHFFAYMSDGDILEAANQPPTVTTGAFGVGVFSGSTKIPPSWSVIGDKLIFSNGVDQHQIYGGTSSYVDKFVVYKGGVTTPVPSVPDEGYDYSDAVSDGQSGTTALLNSLDSAYEGNMIFVMTPMAVTGFYFGITDVNVNAADSGVSYWNGNWISASNLTDNTKDSGGVSTFNRPGTMVFDMPSDVIPKYQYGQSGFWWQIGTNAQLDAATGVSEVTFYGPFQDIVNVWDGVPLTAIEVYVETATSGYELYSSSSVDLTNLSGNSNVYIASSTPIEGIYIDPGSTPNTSGVSPVVNYWNGSAYNSTGSITDNTSGISNAGWITLQRQSDVQKRQFEGSQYYAYWYQLNFNSPGIDSDTTISIELMPYYDINDFGKGRTSCTFKKRTAYSFDLWPSYIYISKVKKPLVLNGTDYGILEVGDGRGNKITAMKKFHNELMVWQEERGLTLIEGYSPATFGNLLLSSNHGTFSQKTVVVIDGVMESTSTDEVLKTLAFFLSHYGVFRTDGRTVASISDQIQNYFDPTKDECIRRGYEDKMWLSYDSAFNVLRLGLVSGSGATTCNVFPVFDLTDKAWYFDSFAQKLSCMTEAEGSGVTPIVQVGGGIDNGTVYHLNYGKNDVNTGIDAFAMIELDYNGYDLWLREILLRSKVQSAGNITITPYLNDIAQSSVTKTMTAKTAGEVIRRDRFNSNLRSDHISLKFQNNIADQELYLESLGLNIFADENR